MPHESACPDNPPPQNTECSDISATPKACEDNVLGFLGVTWKYRNVPKGLVRWQSPEWETLPIRGVPGHGVAPPSLNGRRTDLAVVGVLHGEENDNQSHCEAGVQSRGQDICDMR